MKLYLQAVLISATILLGVSSCKKTDDTPKEDNTPTTPATSSSILKQGAWKVTLFSEDGINETLHFNNYVFIFNTNGIVSAVKSDTTINGTWSTRNDDSQNKLDLDFGMSEPFSELNDDWDIVEKNISKIRLEDVSGGNGGTDLLTFEKN